MEKPGGCTTINSDFFYTHMKSNNKYQILAHPLGIIAW